MASTNVNLNVRGVDKTGGVFSRIARSAKGIFAGIALGGAAYAIARTVKELGNLSDVAMRAGVSVKDITQLGTALSNLGISSGAPEEIARSMQYMMRTTGRTGKDGFWQTIEEISKLPNLAERSKAAVATFGRSGMQYLALIETAAHGGTEALKEYAAIQPHVSNSAAAAGDRVADAWNTVAKGFKATWADAIGRVCNWFDRHFTGGVRQAAYVAYSYVREYFDKIVNYFKNFQNMMSVLGETIVDAFTAPFSGRTLDDVLDTAKQKFDFNQKEWEAADRKATKTWEAYRKKVEEFAKNGGFGDNFLKGIKNEAKSASVARVAPESNKWISGGTYAAATMQRREQMRTADKMLAALVGIDASTRKMAENSEADDVKVLDAPFAPAG